VEFLVEMSFDAASVPSPERAELLAQERELAFDLKAHGIIQRMWRIEGRPATVSIWRAADADELDRQLARLPLRAHLSITRTALITHYLEE
jgi:muconolactone D-isomerase